MVKNIKEGHKTSHNIVGAAGEYFVAAEISRRGAIATITPRNVLGLDILASSIDGRRHVGIQVKTKSAGRDWPLGNKAILNPPEIFYVFPNLSGEVIEYYIIPSSVVFKIVEGEFQEYILHPRRDGNPRLTRLRVFRAKEMQTMTDYKNNWDKLNIF